MNLNHRKFATFIGPSSFWLPAKHLPLVLTNFHHFGSSQHNFILLDSIVESSYIQTISLAQSK
jgi:hypothetical protein